MKSVIVLFLALGLSACAPSGEDDAYACMNADLPPEKGSPTILVIGDSISLGYTPALVDGLPAYDVVHNPCNARNSRLTAQNLGRWLASRPSFEAITFNNGIWDVTDELWTSESEYEANLTFVARAIKAKTTRPLFVLTTKIPPGAIGGRLDSNAVRRNDIALRVMSAEGIPVVDLHTVSAGLDAYRWAPNDVHFHEEGSEILADVILSSLDGLYGIR